ncbi:MAG: hypothetical protein M5U26_27520 [Planctomycetota bacterium]|nr:hypothetical protein [Planctomycetota bacterium]
MTTSIGSSRPRYWKRASRPETAPSTSLKPLAASSHKPLSFFPSSGLTKTRKAGLSRPGGTSFAEPAPSVSMPASAPVRAEKV